MERYGFDKTGVFGPINNGEFITGADHFAAMRENDENKHKELLTIHTILMCPAECKPITETDTYTVKLLKGLINRWHTIEIELRLLRTDF